MKQFTLSLGLALMSLSIQAKDEKEIKMKEKTIEVLKSKEGMQVIHQTFSSHCFNKTWSFIDKKELSKDDIENMIATSYTSLWHWKQRKDCSAQSLSVAYWQLGRVHCLANRLTTAKELGEKCLKVSLEGKLDAFYIGYAYEVLANASILKKDKQSAKNYLAKANEQLKLIENKENQGYLKADLAKLEGVLK